MKIFLRIIGLFLLFMGSLNLISLNFVDFELLRSPVMVIIRYSLMVAAGLGYILLRKWGVVIFFASVFINWVAYFTVYGGEGSLSPLWLTIPVPLTVGFMSYFGWSELSWSSKQSSRKVA